MHRSCTPLVTLLSLTLPAAAQDVEFNGDIRPLLADRCFRCHGPDPSHRKAGLRLDLRRSAFGKLEDGRHAIVAGDPAHSELVRRIRHADPGERMPPPKSGRVLEPREIELLEQWIAGGASWQEHWAFVAPRATVPPATVPPAGGAQWARNPIDAFVWRRLCQADLEPSPPADRRTLIRRVSLDLTGLPPTIDEIEAFAGDDSADAYGKLVDRLLASPHYGEHMARYWLDTARYADTHGLHFDNYREMWPYRDWVIRAFNDNMPFDRFAIEQIAGDLLPDASLDQKIASGFNRAHVTTNEGGSILEEVYVRNVVDRTSTFGTAFLGLTIGCAVCHDHKFDPVTQREFYQLFAFFNNLDGKAMDGNSKQPPPVVRVPSAEQAARAEELSEQVAAAELEILAALRSIDYHEPEAPLPPAPECRRIDVWVDDALPPGAEVEGDLAWVEAPRALVHRGRLAMRRSGAGTHQHLFRHAARKLRIAAGDTLFCWVYLDPTDPPQEIMLQFNADGGAAWQHRAYWGDNLIEFGEDGTAERRRLGDLPAAGAWSRLEVDPATVGLHPGMAVHGLAFTQHGGTAYWDAAGIETTAAAEPADLVWVDDELPRGALPGGDGDTWQWVEGEAPPPLSGRRSLRRGPSGEQLAQDYFTEASPLTLQHGDRLFAYVWLDPEDPPATVQMQFHAGNWNHRARWGREPAHGRDAKDGADHVAGDRPPLGEWLRLEVGLDDVGLKPGDKLTGWAFTQVGGTVQWDRAGVRTWAPGDDRQLHSLAAWASRASDDGALPADVRGAAAVAAETRTPWQQRTLRDYYLRHVYAGARAQMEPLEAAARALRDQLAELESAMPTTMVMVERTEPRPAFVLERGEYDRRGAPVERDTPAVLPPMAAELPRDRLGLARWLTSAGHPLAARVAVNRLWQQLFGVGIVKTSEDFGNQGSPPSHPQLLDWLARQFVADGWDVKQTMRRIVLSATYRQSSVATPELLARDPENRLLARAPRYRLDAETLRDQALAVSKLLEPAIGGASVKPPQPDGLWRAVGYVGSNTDKFVADNAPEKVHRRSIYTFWKRTSPPPEMTTFDAPSRESCIVRRERTNTPLQALLMLNDPQYVEAARHLAQRMMCSGGEDPRARARFGFYCASGRPPAGDEIDALVRLYQEQCQDYSAAAGDAAALIQIGTTPPPGDLDPVELAAWTVVANVLLNLDEVVNRN